MIEFQVLVPQVEKMCIDKGVTEEGEILRFLQNGTLVGLLPVPHPILIRRYQANKDSMMWFRLVLVEITHLETAFCIELTCGESFISETIIPPSGQRQK